MCAFSLTKKRQRQYCPLNRIQLQPAIHPTELHDAFEGGINRGCSPKNLRIEIAQMKSHCPLKIT